MHFRCHCDHTGTSTVVKIQCNVYYFAYSLFAWGFRGPTQFLTSTVVVCPADGSVSGNLSTSSSCSETYTSYSDIKPWPCCRRRPHSIPRASTQTISRGGITIPRSWPWQEELDHSCFSSHRHPSSQLVGSSPKKKTKAIVASADITSVLAEYSLHPPFLLFTIFTVSPTANEKNPLFSLLFQILSAVDMTSALVECSVCFNSSFQSQKVQMI